MYIPGTRCLIVVSPPLFPHLLNTTVVVGASISTHDCGRPCWMRNRILQDLVAAENDQLQFAIEYFKDIAYPIAFLRPIGPPKDPDVFNTEEWNRSTEVTA